MPVDEFTYAFIAKEENYSDNDYIIKEGTSGDWVYIILKGKVKVKKMTAKGLITVDTLREGEIFGEMILWQAGRGARTASVVADGPVKVGVLDTEALLKEYEKLSPRLKGLMKSLIKRLSETTQKAVTIAVETN
ncbi:MAG: cyclic nucleotide-binding domain-containing protein [Deltaproteobacteria bacterium]|nr:cyclic nucleotide-binding domain-containing protein [Deltaproteobacteria bacterium]